MRAWLWLAAGWPWVGWGQVYLRAHVADGDTIPVLTMRPAYVIERMPAKARRALARRQRLYRDIRKVMPYARAVAQVVNELNTALDTIPTPAQRRAYLKQREKQLWARYEQPLRRLTYRQGKLLIKLISRETNNTTYRLIKEYKNTRTALFWGGIARLFGMNLNYHYDPDGKDAAIEAAIRYLYPEARREE